MDLGDRRRGRRRRSRSPGSATRSRARDSKSPRPRTCATRDGVVDHPSTTTLAGDHDHHDQPRLHPARGRGAPADPGRDDGPGRERRRRQGVPAATRRPPLRSGRGRRQVRRRDGLRGRRRCRRSSACRAPADIGPTEAAALASFQYPAPLQPDGEANRTEIDVTKQVITLYENYQVRLITTTSTGSGQRYCYNTPRVNPTQHICEAREHAVRAVHLHPLRERLGQVAARSALQPLLLQRRHRGARLPVGADLARVARLRAHPDAHRRVLPHARARR